jgi:hypothetical protein
VPAAKTGGMTPVLIFAALLICTAPLQAAPTPTPKPARTAQAQLPVAVPVPGNPGHVYSPYAKGKIIAVTGYPHGTVVLCPYTVKKFRVP